VEGVDQKSSGSAVTLSSPSAFVVSVGQPHRFAGLVAPDDGTIPVPKPPEPSGRAVVRRVRRGISRLIDSDRDGLIGEGVRATPAKRGSGSGSGEGVGRSRGQEPDKDHAREVLGEFRAFRRWRSRRA